MQTDEERKEKARIRTRKWRENNLQREKENCKKYAKNNKEKLKNYHKKWCENNSDKIALISKKWRENNKEKIQEKNKNYREREKELRTQKENIIKHRARSSLKARVYRGKIVRPNYCVQCNKECIPDGHHYDYSKPFDVKWLCKECHGKEHRKKRI